VAGRPAWDAALPPWQHRAAAWMHAALYGLLLVVPALGYLTAATAPAQVPTLFLGVIPVPHLVGTDPAWFAVLRQVHRALAILLVALAATHALAALANHRRGQRGLVAMWRG
jgi:cytochrome b561